MEGLETIDWTEGQDDCKEGREEKSKPEAERSRAVAEKTGKAEVSNYIFGARDMDNVAGEFGNIVEMASLSGEPRPRNRKELELKVFDP